jgi:hypothetical protein
MRCRAHSPDFIRASAPKQPMHEKIRSRARRLTVLEDSVFYLSPVTKARICLQHFS